MDRDSWVFSGCGLLLLVSIFPPLIIFVAVLCLPFLIYGAVGLILWVGDKLK